MENRRGRDFTPREEARDSFFQLNKERLEHMAFRAIRNKGLTPDQFIAVAIDVDDPSWTEVVDVLMPNQDWQAIRDRGEKPVARGTVRSEIVDYLCKVVPDIASALTSELPDGVVRAVVMAEKGASVYYIEPFPHFKDN